MMAKIPGAPHTQIDLTKGSLPVLVAITLLCAVAASAYGVGSFVSSLLSDQTQANQKFQKIETELTAIRGLLQDGSFLKKSDFDLWCKNVEILNKGFRCGNIR
jgi:hypothetical protein